MNVHTKVFLNPMEVVSAKDVLLKLVKLVLLLESSNDVAIQIISFLAFFLPNQISTILIIVLSHERTYKLLAWSD